MRPDTVALLFLLALLSLVQAEEGRALHELLAADASEDEIDDKVAFLVDSSDNLVVIRKQEPGQTKTMLYFLNMMEDYTKLISSYKTPFDCTNKDWEFAMDSNNNVMVVRKRNGASNKTEVFRMSRSSNYSAVDLGVSIPLHYTDDDYVFLMDSANNLVAIKRNNTASRATEFHRFTGKNNFATQDLQLATGLNRTNDSYSFMLDAFDNLVVVNRRGATNTELYRYTKSSDYVTCDRNVSTWLPRTSGEYVFALDGRDRLLAIHKGPNTNSGKTHVQRLHGPTYDKVELDKGTAVGYTSLLEVPAPEPWPREGRPTLMRAEHTSPETAP